ncbi:glycosyltransferase [Lihuaxuella thermophila]|uniref:Glycosyltransferase involved in cell wall bisynthesis n=1 Tax=Lihuaxuella thermophila TaxID=1173111 RepID=A0A1H8G361_9BACL|nr:glycosyltransferase [Lihuaxuella thermophila]SEN38329.1 Glycosyltransferase involved in cell wall bisynthesis [Lihuaxuella thermophila]
MRSVLVYYPFTLATKADSGSKLRPIEMLKAFEAWGNAENVKVIAIHGNSRERKEQFHKLRKNGELDQLLFCYVENQTIPVWLTDPGHIPKAPFIDWTVFRFLKKKGVPIGVFYRDVYWKFDELYPLKGWKKKLMRMVYRIEEKFFQTYAKAIFLPSLAMGEYVGIDRMKAALPPGGKSLSEPKPAVSKRNYEGLYVGGIAHRDYGLSLMLDALEIVKSRDIPFSLTIVCREGEYQALPENEKVRISECNVQVKHVSGPELDALYREMDFALIPRFPSKYNHFSVPVKLVEYLSNRLPVIATNCTAQQSLIESGPYGTICEATPESMAQAIEKMIENQAVYAAQIERDFLRHHSWLARVRTVKSTLIEEGVL